MNTYKYVILRKNKNFAFGFTVPNQTESQIQHYLTDKNNPYLLNSNCHILDLKTLDFFACFQCKLRVFKWNGKPNAIRCNAGTNLNDILDLSGFDFELKIKDLFPIHKLKSFDKETKIITENSIKYIDLNTCYNWVKL